jgi:hypothetical protein
MVAHKVAHVCIAPVEGPSRIETYYGNEKLIRIYLTIRPNVGQVQNFKQSILQDFISVVQGYAVVNFEANNLISPDTIRLFLSVCQQNNRIDRHSTANSEDHHASPPNPRAEDITPPTTNHLLTGDEEVKSMQDILQRIVQVSSNPAQLTHETITDIINDIGRGISPANTNISRNIINPQPQPQPTPSMGQRSLINPQPQPIQQVPFNMQQPDESTTGQPVNPLVALLQQLSTQPPFMAIRQMPQTTSSVNSIDDSEPPARFIVNERNSREVLIHQNPQTDITIDSQPIDDNLNVRSVPSHHTSISNVQRCGVSEESIIMAARCVYNTISSTAIRPPDFTNTTRSGYRKIKNFIHNLTKFWLSQAEIDKFLIEIDKLYAPLVSGNEFEVGLD